jgi:hypothetical protein
VARKIWQTVWHRPRRVPGGYHLAEKYFGSLVPDAGSAYVSYRAGERV